MKDKFMHGVKLLIFCEKYIQCPLNYDHKMSKWIIVNSLLDTFYHQVDL